MAAVIDGVLGLWLLPGHRRSWGCCWGCTKAMGALGVQLALGPLKCSLDPHKRRAGEEKAEVPPHQTEVFGDTWLRWLCTACGRWVTTLFSPAPRAAEPRSCPETWSRHCSIACAGVSSGGSTARAASPSCAVAVV